MFRLSITRRDGCQASVVILESEWQGKRRTSQVESLRRLIPIICWVRIDEMLDEPRRRTFTDDKVETHEDEVLVVREPLSAVLRL